MKASATWRFCLAAVWMATVAATGAVQAGTIYVTTGGNDSADGLSWATAKQTVQAGLNAAVSGDQVWVAAGRYVQCITLVEGVALYGGFAGTETDLSQRNWTTNVTTLDGNQAGSVVTGPTGATAATRIDGFTITKGKTYQGGGLYLSSSSLTIANNKITGNSASQSGGGLFASSGSPTITNNTITGNTVTSNPDAFGGGMYLASCPATVSNNTITGNSAAGRDFGCGGGLYLYGSSSTIVNNTIMGNSAYGTYAYGSSSSRGGGLYVIGNCTATISNNTIMGNYASHRGGGLLSSSSSLTITNNIIAGNTAADGTGGGLYLDYGSPTIANNTIAGNSASYGGGGLYLQSCSSSITNNTVTGNSAGSGGGLYLSSSSPTLANTIVAFNSSGIYQSGGTTTLRCNCVYGNGAYDYSGLTDPTGTDGNIKADPLLEDWPYRRLHVQPGSPCINAGSDSDVQAGWLDMDGQVRIQGGRADIGADESDGTTWPAVPVVIVRVSPTGNDANDGSSWALAKRTVQAGIDAASAAVGEVWVAAGTYSRITMRSYAYVYGGFAGSETQRDQRDWKRNVTILDGQRNGSVVTAQGGGWRQSTVDGFTITNGSGAYGAGVYVSSSPRIANNTIAGNTATSRGGGLYVLSSSPEIINNTITGNSASEGGSRGGGLYLENASATLAGNIITGNGASDGGGLYLTGSPATIINNTITGNGASTQGGGLYLSSSSPTIANTIVAFNTSGIYQSGGTTTLRCNCVYGNGAYDYSGLTDPTGTNGNVKADPIWADRAYRDLHVQPGSPCIDAGNDADVQSGWVDIDGQARIQNGRVDIGADESDGTTWTPGPYTIVRVSPAGNDANDGSSWALAKRTVQAGINAAGAVVGEVWVAAGNYPEKITLRSYAHVYGGFARYETQRDQRNWKTNVTILDGNGSGTVVTGALAAAAPASVDGFTITNGSSSSGGGVYLYLCPARIANNTIKNSYGSGVRMSYSAATIVNNTIVGNYVLSGGGISVSNCSPAIINNTIAGNGASQGGALHLSGSSATILGNTITGNSASTAGGGLYLNNSSPTIANTIVAFNSSGIYQTGGTTTLRYNCVYGNAAYDYSGLTDPTGTNGNIRTDPLLADWKYWGLHLRSGSPCINTGSDADAQSSWVDMDGQARIQNGRVDIGADESDGTAWTPGPYIVVRVSPNGNDANDGSSWTLAKRTVQAGVNAASAAGGEVWVAAGTYYERIAMRPHVHMYGGFAGSETQRDERSWQANLTTLNGERWGTVVTVQAGGWRTNTIDGFTITNGGYTSNGGGLYLSGASPTIANNTITGNIASGATPSGGGLSLLHSSPAIINNTITGNSATVTGSPLPPGGASGGGLYLSSSSPTIANNKITGNSASGSYGYGGGMWLSNSPATISNNTITSNSAPTAGGGLYLSNSSPTIANTIVVFNTSGIYQTGGTTTLRYDCVYGNTQYNFFGLTNPTGTNGNISVDPRFVRQASAGADAVWGTADDDYGDLRLLAGSPCIDAGRNTDVPTDIPDLNGNGNRAELLPFDLAGGPRFFDNATAADTGAGTPPIVDIGAYESLPGDVDGDGHVDVLDLLCLADAWGSITGDTNYDRRCDFDIDGSVDVLDLLTLAENWGL